MFESNYLVVKSNICDSIAVDLPITAVYYWFMCLPFKFVARDRLFIS